MPQAGVESKDDNASVTESTATLVESPSVQSSSKDYDAAAVDLFSQYGFGGHAPILPAKPKKQPVASKDVGKDASSKLLAKHCWSSSRS